MATDAALLGEQQHYNAFATMAWYTLKEDPPEPQDTSLNQIKNAAKWIIYIALAGAACTLFIPPTLEIVKKWGLWTQPYLLFGAIVPNIILEWLSLDYLYSLWNAYQKEHGEKTSYIQGLFNIKDPTAYDYIKKVAYITSVIGLAFLSSFVFAAVAWYTTAFPGGLDNPIESGNMIFAWVNFLCTLTAGMTQFIYSLHALFSGTNPMIRAMEKGFIRFFIGDNFQLHQQEAAEALRHEITAMIEQARQGLVQVLDAKTRKDNPDNEDVFITTVFTLQRLEKAETGEEILKICAELSRRYQPEKKRWYRNRQLWKGLGIAVAVMVGVIGVIPFAVDTGLSLEEWGIHTVLALSLAALSSIPMGIFFFKLTCDLFMENPHIAKRLSPVIYGAFKWLMGIACILSVATGADLVAAPRGLYTSLIKPAGYLTLLIVMIAGTAIGNAAACLTFVKNRITVEHSHGNESKANPKQALFADAYEKLGTLNENIKNMPIEKVVDTALAINQDQDARKSLIKQCVGSNSAQDNLAIITTPEAEQKHHRFNGKSQIKTFFSGSWLVPAKPDITQYPQLSAKPA